MFHQTEEEEDQRGLDKGVKRKVPVSLAREEGRLGTTCGGTGTGTRMGTGRVQTAGGGGGHRRAALRTFTAALPNSRLGFPTVTKGNGVSWHFSHYKYTEFYFINFNFLSPSV